MAYFNKKQVDEIRNIDLLTYLKTCEPHELVRVSGNEYSTRTHDSLKISKGKMAFFRDATGCIR